MQPRIEFQPSLEARIAEALMGDLVGPRDLEVEIEVVCYDDDALVALEIETDCREPLEDVETTTKFVRVSAAS